MRQEILKKKAALLRHGMSVKINGLIFSAIKIAADAPEPPCFYCDVDCLCKGDVADVCNELDVVGKYAWHLHLES